MDRRTLLVALAAAAVGALSACSTTEPFPFGLHDPDARPATRPDPSATPSPPPSLPTKAPPPSPTPTPTPQQPPVLTKVPLPAGEISSLPGTGNLLAWTVDDGADTDVVAAYAQFAKDSGVRLTFFVNGMYPSWTDNARALQPLVDSGQAQTGNHTFNHVNLTTASDLGIVNELTANDTFIRNTFGADAAPFYRPPYGYTNARTERIASSIGYHAPVMWYGTLSDSGLIRPDQVVEFATAWFLPQHIVIGHANFPPVTTVYGQLLDIIHERGLQTVTLNDVLIV